MRLENSKNKRHSDWSVFYFISEYYFFARNRPTTRGIRQYLAINQCDSSLFLVALNLEHIVILTSTEGLNRLSNQSLRSTSDFGCHLSHRG